MLYAILSEDVPDSLPLRQKVRESHIARLQALDAEGRLRLAGPHPDPDGEGFTGSLVVAEFATLAEATAWAEADPYVHGGVYRKTRIKPFKQVFPG